MSLLLQALQKASKNREGGEQEPAPTPDPLDSEELSLEPLGSPEAAGHSDFGIEAPAAPPPSPAQAAAVMRASRVPAFDPIEYVREHYMIAFVGAAVLAAIAYGTYVYIQVANPAWLRSKPSVAPPASPIGAAPPPPPPPIAAGPAEAPAAKISGIPEGTPVAAGATAAVVASAPAAAAAQPATAAASDAAASLAASENRSLATSIPAVAPPKSKRAPTSRSRRAMESPVRQMDEDGIETVILQSAEPTPQRRAEAPVATTPSDLIRAYEALQAGDSALAKSLYTQVLDADPRNIDALLGLGAIASKEGRVEDALRHYQRILELEPRNGYAQAGLIAIIGGADPAASETRLRQLIARDPSAFLYFTLGNLYADQGQWPGAQQAYFQAFQSQPDNPDYAFNLAVGLEHLGQTRQALDHYRKALDLSFRKGRANFDQNLVIQRVGQLSSRVEQ